jgi:hypothetical protein
MHEQMREQLPMAYEQITCEIDRSVMIVTLPLS